MFIALLSYRTTPLESGFSPAELLMCRKLRTNLPQLPSNLSKVIDPKMLSFKNDKESKVKAAENYNSRHNAKDMSPLQVGDSVWVIDIRKYGKIVEICNEPRSYVIQTEVGLFRRNRWHLIHAPYHFNDLMDSIEPTNFNIYRSNVTNVNPNQDKFNNLKSESNRYPDCDIEICNNDSVRQHSDAFVDSARKSTREKRMPKYLSDYVLE